MDFEYKYNPDEDPLIQRARSRSPHSHKWVWIIVALLLAWIGYSEVLPKLRGKLGSSGSGPHLITAESPASGKVTSESALAQRPADGPFKFIFNQGQKMVSGLSIAVEGKGNPALTGSTGLSLGLETDFTLTVTGIDAAGNAELQVDFQDANLHGNHFGCPVNLQRRNGVVRSYADNLAAPPPTFANTHFQRPDLSALEAPIMVRLAPNGTPVNLQEDPGGPHVVITVLQLSGMQFPSPGLVVGDVWEREHELYWPGLKARIPVVVRTTYLSDGVYWGRNCACLQSVIQPGKARGKLAAIGRVDVSGVVNVYWDLDLHRVLCNQADLDFDLILAGGLESAAELFGVYSGMLEDVEGGKKFDLKAAATKTGPDEPIGFHVRSNMSFKG